MPGLKSFGEWRFARSQWAAGAALVAWACATADNLPKDEGAYDPTGGSSGSGGGAARNGSGGSSAQSGTGGSSAASGGSAALGSGGTAAVGGGGTAGVGVTGGVSGGGVGPSAGSTATGGRSASGGVSPMSGAGGSTAGASTTGGGGGATGDGGRGGDANGGSATAGGSSTGGTGAAGVPNDPNWKPPDMVPTAKVVVLYHPQQTAASSRDVRMDLTFKNQTDTNYPLSGVTVRYWMSAEPPPQLHIDYSSAGLKASAMPEFVGNMGNSYVEFSFGATGIIPPYVDQASLNNDTKIQVRIDTNINSNFNQANDWSYDGAAGDAKPNPKMTMYDGDTLIWGCEPSHVCAEAEEPPPMGDAGAGAL